MGTTEAPTVASPIYPTVYEIPPTGNYQGFPINNIVFVKPSVMIRFDDFQHGIGGYSEN